MLRRSLIAGLVSLGLVAPAARAEVVFGNNVHIGGHDVSHQRFDSRHRGVFYLHEGRPRHPGCTVRRNYDGSHTKVCHYHRGIG
jgi:plastocyanin